jgi:hypothetical protein
VSNAFNWPAIESIAALSAQCSVLSIVNSLETCNVPMDVFTFKPFLEFFYCHVEIPCLQVHQDSMIGMRKHAFIDNKNPNALPNARVLEGD